MHAQSRWLLEVYYDGWCPLCTGIRKRLERWDWLHVLQFYSIRELQTSEQISVPMEQLVSTMHVREIRSGRIRSGIEAVFVLSVRVPILIPFSPFIWLSMKIGIGSKVYKYIASRRTIVPAGQCDHNSCELPERVKSSIEDPDKQTNRT